MLLEKWRPQTGLATLEHEMEKFMDEFLTRRPFTRFMSTAVPTPHFEMFDKKDELVVRAEVPGMTRDELHVSLDGDLLTIRGEKKKEKEIKEEEYFFSEREYGGFSRTVQLPVRTKADNVNATLNNGVLELHLVKADEAKKEVKIEVK